MTTLTTDQKWTLSHFHISYQNSKISWQKMSTILVKSTSNALKIEVFQKKSFIEEIHFSCTFFVIDMFWKLQFLKHLKHFLLKLCPFFVSWFWSFVNLSRVIFDQSPKLDLGFDVRPEIPILKGIYFFSQIHIFFQNCRPYKEVTCLEEDLKKAILLNNENMERDWMKSVK